MFKLSLQFLATLLILSAAVISPVSAETTSTPKNVKPISEMQNAAKTAKKPIVAVVKADWCPACQKIDPTIKALMKDYMATSQWVMLDVTNKTTAAEARQKAQDMGLEDFYKQFGARTSTVAIIDPDSKKVLKVFMAEDKREKYVIALDKAIADLQE